MNDLKDMPVVTVEQVNRLRDTAIAYAEQSSKEIERLNALVAMKDEALKVADKVFRFDSIGKCDEQEILLAALSTSPESIAAWEAEKLLPLQRQVAMLVHLFTEWRQDHLSDHQLIEAVIATNTQATAEAFVLEIEQRAIERYKLEKP